MRPTKVASKVHRWLALLIGGQIVLWFASGWFLSFFPIEQVRGEHLARQPAAASLRLNELAPAVAHVSAHLPADTTRIEVRPMLGRTVLFAELGKGRSMLIDVATGRRLSPLPASAAVAIARADYAGAGKPVRARAVGAETTQYRGPLPAWRVEFDDPENTSIYVAADQGTVTARRTDLWRIYDFLWGLHIMDWKNHENTNSWWLWGAAALSLVAAVSGMVLLPSRLGWNKRQNHVRAATK
jgi:hypothetical protein